MGVGINAMAALLGTATVATSKIGTAIEGSSGNNQISEANDASKNEMAAKKAKLNAYKLKTDMMKARFERKKLNDKKKAYKEKMANKTGGNK